MLCDKLVCGLRNETTQWKLLTVKDLTVAKAYEIARGMEAAYQHSSELQTAHQHHEAHKIVHEGARGSHCWRCNRTGHTPDKCYFKAQQCRKCNKQGHIAKMCRKQLPAKPSNDEVKCVDKKAKYIEQDIGGFPSENQMEMGLFTIKAVTNQSNGGIFVTPDVNGVLLYRCFSFTDFYRSLAK